MGSTQDPAALADAAGWFFENSSDGFAISRGGRILSVNQAWCDILDCSRQTAVELSPQALIHPSDIDAYYASERDLALHGVVELEGRLRKARSEWVWVRTSVKRGPDGYAMIVIHDLTRERALLAESEAAAKVNDLLRTSAGLVTWRFDPATESFTSDTDFASAGAVQIRAGQNIPLHKLSAVIHPDDRDDYLSALAVSSQSGSPGEAWYRRALPQGGHVRFRSNWRGLRLSATGRWVLIGISQDMTELLEARDRALQGEQAAREANDVKSRFLANMSHEIRTPLHAVLGVLHLVDTNTASPETKSLIREAVASGQMLTALFNSILDLSAIEHGDVALIPEAVDVDGLLVGVMDMLRPQIDAKGLSLSRAGELNLPVTWLDPTRLRQILFNLIGNAGKFTHRGGVTVRAATLGTGRDRRLRVEIEDTGVGISAQDLGTLFARFQQADSSTTRRFGGAGVGLAISQRLAQLMDGEVGVRSEVGRGSTFWLDIAAPPAAAADADAANEASPLTGLNVLVVDDNAVNRRIASELLATLGARVATAEDGAAAVGMTLKNGFDLILMDIQMPVMDGVEAAKAIRSGTSPNAAIPILAMTANVLPDQVASYRAAGMDGVVAKPVAPAALISAIAGLYDAAVA